VKRATVSADGETITVHIPLTFRKRGGRKLVVTPDGAAWAPRPRVDNAMVKALARAFRWRMMLDTGEYATLEDLARAKRVHATYVSRVLRLTLLAPGGAVSTETSRIVSIKKDARRILLHSVPA
jgi:hypothetical protein